MNIDRKVIEQALEAIRIFREWEMGQDYNSNRETVLARAFAAEEALEAALEQPEQEPVAWRTFDGEGGYDYRTYDDNENYRDEWDRRNPNHKGWVEPLYEAPPPCPTCEALARTVMMDQTGRD